MSLLFLLLLNCVPAILSIEVTASNPKIFFVDKQYINYLNMTLRKLNRQIGVVINVNLDLVWECGNNVTVSMTLMEHLSGRYQPMGITFEYKLCDWLNKEPFIGRMWAKYLPVNACPFPKGPLHIANATIGMQDFPYHIPFTWSRYKVLTRMDVIVTRTDTKAMLIQFYMHFAITQKERNQKKKISGKTTTSRPKRNKTLISNEDKIPI